MSTRRTDDGTYPNADEERAKNDDRASHAREPLETEHAEGDDDPPPRIGQGDDGGTIEATLVRRAEVRVDAVVDFLDGLDGTEWISLALEDFSDGSSELVVLAVDKDSETELVRIDAGAFFSAIVRLRAFSVDPSPPRERTLGDVSAALEGLLRDAGPALAGALGVPPRPPLRPVPGGRR